MFKDKKRVIKFRAWLEGKMYDWSYILNNGGLNDSWTNESEAIMQYTGLSDSNNREVYEGDIVHEVFSKNVKSEYEVIFYGTGFKKKYPPRWLGDTERIEELNAHTLAGRSVVVGNIFEGVENEQI